MTTKKTYRRPNTTVVLLAAESSLMTISASTSDPTEGGDPTGGDNSTPKSICKLICQDAVVYRRIIKILLIKK